jgi:hypothetical protein
VGDCLLAVSEPVVPVPVPALSLDEFDSESDEHVVPALTAVSGAVSAVGRSACAFVDERVDL